MNSEPDLPEGDQMREVNLNMSHKLLEIAVKTCQVEREAETFLMPKQDPQQEEMGRVFLFFNHAYGTDFEVEFPVCVMFELWNQKN